MAYLRGRAADMGQKTLDMERQAIQAMMVNVTGQLSPGATLPVVKFAEPHRSRPRANSLAEVRAIAARQDARNALATETAHTSGIRAHELLTLGHPGEQPPDDRRERSHLTGTAAEGMKFTGRDGVVYTVVGKGRLVREVLLPHRLAESSVPCRRPGPMPRGAAAGRPGARRRPQCPLPAALRRRRRTRVERVVLLRQHGGAREDPGRPRYAPRVRPGEDAGTHAPRRTPARAGHRVGGIGASPPGHHADLCPLTSSQSGQKISFESLRFRQLRRSDRPSPADVVCTTFVGHPLLCQLFPMRP